MPDDAAVPHEELASKYPWMSMAPNVAWFRAKQLDREAQYVLAFCYLKGVHQEKSVKNASIWFGKAATGGHVGAQYQYGLLWLSGRGVPKQDESEAAKWIKRAAEAGHAEAMYTLGVFSLSGLGVPESQEAAISWFGAASEVGFMEAQYHYALYLEQETSQMSQENHSLEIQEKLASIVSEVCEVDQGADFERSMKELALGWYLRAARQGHALAQHRAAILFGMGYHAIDEQTVKMKKQWPSRPSVVTWARSHEASKRAREAKPLSSLPSVICWFISGKKSKPPPDHKQAAQWHKKASRNMVLPSMYAYGVQKAQGRGTPRNETLAMELFSQAAAGHRDEDAGAMTSVQYECPNCQHWNINAVTFEKPKGDTRCAGCREDRCFPKDLKLVNNMTIGESSFTPTSSSSSPLAGSRARRRGLETSASRSPSSAAGGITRDGGSNVRSKHRRAPLHALELEGTSSMGVLELAFQVQIGKVGGNQVTVMSKEVQLDGSGSFAADSPSRSIQRGPSHGIRALLRTPSFGTREEKAPTLSGKELEKAVKVTSLEYQGEPKLMHVLGYVGGFIRAKVENEGNVDVGSFHVEFYVTGKDETPQQAGQLLYGGRIFVQSLPAQAEAVVRVDNSARCPLGAKTGESMLWAGIRAVPYDRIPSAFTDFCKLSVKGVRWAMLTIADATWHGQAGVHRDLREAIRWYHKIQGSVDQGGRDCAGMLSTDLHVMMCGPLPMDLCPMSKAKGLPQAWLSYALSIDRHNGHEQRPLSAWEMELIGDGFDIMDDWGVAASWMHLAAEEGNLAQAQLNLAVWYAKGCHVPKSMPQASYWFKRAADQGLADAQYNLGILHQEGNGLELDPELAATLFGQAVDKGHVAAHLSLGLCYLEGKGVDQDTELAVKLLHVPAREGMPVAQFNLGCLFSMGQGVEATICFAMALYKGEGVSRDLPRSAVLLEKCAEGGHKQAQYNIGVMFARGEGVKQDRDTAAYWWKLSAAQGHALAQLELGQYHQTLSEEAVQSAVELQRSLMNKLCASRELFDKFLMVDRFKCGFGRSSRPLFMDARLFCSLLEKVVQIVPVPLSRDDVYQLVGKVNQRQGQDQKQFSFTMFLFYMEEVGKRSGIGLDPTITASEHTGPDEWVVKKKQLRASRDQEKYERKERDLIGKEMIDTKTLLDSMRGIVPPRPLRLSDAHKRIRKAEQDIIAMKLEEKREREGLEFQRWRQVKAKEKYTYSKQMADGLGAKMKIQESNEMHREAERFRKEGERAGKMMERRQEGFAAVEKRVKRAMANKSKAEAIVGDTVDEDWREEEEEMKAAQRQLDGEYAIIRSGKAEAIELRMKHMEEAATLFLDAAHQGLVEAQFNVAQLYGSGVQLPEGWIPTSEATANDKDRGGIAAYRLALDRTKTRKKSKKREQFVEFSFQGDIERRVAQRVEEEQKRKMAVAMKEHSHIVPPTDPKHPAHIWITRTTGAGRVGGDSQEDEVLHAKEFEEWVKRRCRAERAAHWFMEAAQGGNAAAQFQMGMMHLRGFRETDDPTKDGEYMPLPRDSELAISWLGRAARAGHPEGTYRYGMCLAQGIGVDADMNRATEWLEKSAELGVPEGVYQLGLCYEAGRGLEKDATVACRHYRRAAEMGLVNAQVSLAICLERGEGVERDEKEAVEWYRKAAEQSSEAQYLLGKCLEDGRGVRQDERKAAQMFLAAAGHHSTAQLQLGVAYQYGIGVRRDPEEAFHCFLRAAEKGNAEAVLNVALCYNSGVGVPEDMHKYQTWLHRAANAGNPRALEMLAVQRPNSSMGHAISPTVSASRSTWSASSTSR